MENRGSTKLKHYANKGMLVLNNKKNKRIALISGVLLIAVIALKVSLGGDDHDTDSPQAVTVANQKNGQPKAIKSVSFFEMPPRLVPAIDTNLANTFSNLGFILNPTYAKKHKISPKIVAAKKRICLDYINRFSAIAQKEMGEYGIPASITLAQGLLESNAGASKLATENNNHFGIKCFQKNCTANHCTNYTDDTHKDFFRKYGSSWESYRAHSKFLLKTRYKHLLKLEATDYKAWAKGLRAAGYATDPIYANKIIKLIEILKLYEYDSVQQGEKM